MKTNRCIAGLLFVLTVAARGTPPLALVGGTVIDVSAFGSSSHDIPDAVVVVRGDRIEVAGRRAATRIPADATVIDVRGSYLIPGLIDGFAALDNQAYANAYLYMGVTSIIGAHGGRRHALYERASPAPRIYRLEPVADAEDAPVSMPALLAQINSLAQTDTRVLLLMYRLTPPELEAAVARARQRGLATLGELGHSSYSQALDCGVDAFVHSSRYSMDMAPTSLRQAVADDPFGQAAREYSQWLASLAPESGMVARHARTLGDRGAVLMPTLALYSLDLPGASNPWKETAAAILDPRDVHDPVDPASGRREVDAAQGDLRRQLALNVLELERRYRRAGARYLAGSGTDVYGTLPGISLHHELELLVRIGLTPREALASATANFSEALRWRDMGGIRPGSLADILVLEGNPALDIRNVRKIRYLVFRGDVLDRSNLLAHPFR